MHVVTFHYLAEAVKQLSSWLSTTLVLPITQLVFVFFGEIVRECSVLAIKYTDSSMKVGY